MTIYYVDPLNGNDTTGTGLLFASAWKSTTKAASVVAAGDTIRLCATTTEALTGTNTITLTTTGGYLTPVTWIGYNATGTAPLTGANYYTIDGSGMSGATDIIATSTTDYQNFTNISLRNSKRFALSSTGGSFANSIQLTNCSIYNPVTACFGSPSGTNGLNYLAINCTLTGSGSGGSQYCVKSTAGASNRQTVSMIGCLVSAFNTVYQAAYCIGLEIYANNVYANNGTVLAGSIYYSTSSITNCLFYGNSVALAISDRSAASRFLFISNCSFVNNATAILANSANNAFQFEDYNHFYNNTTNYNGAGLIAGSHDISGNPLFNAAGSLDFRLQAGSPLIGAGSGGTNIAGLTQIAGGGSTVYVVVSRRVPQRYSMPWFNRIRSVPIPVPCPLPIIRRNIVNVLPKTNIRTRVAFLPAPPKTQPIVQRRLISTVPRQAGRGRTIVLPASPAVIPLFRSRFVTTIKTLQPRRTFVFVQPLKYVPMSRSRLIVRSPVVCVRRTTFVRAVTNVTQSLIVTSPRIVR